MVAILQTIFKFIFLNGYGYIDGLNFSSDLFPGLWITINHHLVQIMACRRTVDKPLSEPMTSLFTDAHMHDSVRVPGCNLDWRRFIICHFWTISNHIKSMLISTKSLNIWSPPTPSPFPSSWLIILFTRVEGTQKSNAYISSSYHRLLYYKIEKKIFFRWGLGWEQATNGKVQF